MGGSEYANTKPLPSNSDGLLIPRISAFPSTDPTASQNGMIVYLTTTVGVTEAAALATQEFYAGQTKGGDKVTEQMEEIIEQRNREYKILEDMTGIKGVEKTVTEETAF